jgi:type IV secretory pathway ATPase VirB11/archaellum biosynthesis ATPase
MFAKLRENPETNRAGLPWTNEEHQQLLEEIDTDLTLEEIAKKHQRTPSAILQRLLFETSKRVHEHQMNIDEACESVGVSREDFDAFEKKKEQKRIKNTEAKKLPIKENKKVDSEKILIEIQESLKSISQQLAFLTEKIK